MKFFRFLPFLLLFYNHAFSQCSSLKLDVDKQKQCAPGVVEFTLSGAPSGSSYMWDFGNGFYSNSNTVFEFFVDPKIVDVQVDITFPDGTKCTVLKDAIAEITDKPIPSFEISRKKLCDGPDTVTFTNTTPNTKSISWIIDGTNYMVGDIEQIHAFKTAGTKDLGMVVVDSFGCRAVRTFTEVAIVHPDVLIDFKTVSPEGCVVKTVQLEPSMDAQGEKISSYFWMFQGADIKQFDSFYPPTIKYDYPGQFDISFEVKTSNGCTHKLVKDNYLNFGDSLEVNIDISDTITCIGKSIVVKSLNPVYGVFTWDLPGSTLIEKINDRELIVQYDKPGTYDIGLEISYNSCYSSAVIKNAVKVNQVTAAFSSDDNYHCYTPHVTHLKNESSSYDNHNLSYQWRYFNDEGVLIGTSTNEIDSVISSDWGEFDVQLIATDGDGCTDTSTFNQFIRVAEIKPNFKSDEFIGCVNQLITVKSKTPPSSYISTDAFNWVLYDQDDTTILYEGSGYKFGYRFKDPGFYHVKLTAANTIGCKDSLIRLKYLQIVNPVKGFTINDPSICENDSGSFTATTTPQNAPFQFAWKITNNQDITIAHSSYDTSRNVKFKLAKAGEYDISYYHRINNGCYDSLKNHSELLVNGLAGEVILDEWNGCEGMVVKPKFNLEYNIHATNPSDSLIYIWTVNGQAHQTITKDMETAAPSIQFLERGIYEISLQVFNSTQCMYSTKSSRIYIGVIADFKMSKDRVCAGDTVLITNTSAYNPTSYKWNIESEGDYELKIINTSAVLIPKNNATYSIRLEANKNNECFDEHESDLASIIVTSEFEMSDTHLFCAPAYAQFHATSQNADSFYWQFGDGKSLTTSDEDIANIYERNSGMAKGFDITLVSKSNIGCSDTLISPGRVKVIGPKPSFTLDNIVGCVPLEVAFTNTSSDYSSSLLNFDDGGNLDSTSNSLKHSYIITNSMDSETFIPSMFATDSLGCSAVFYSEDTIIVYKQPDIIPISQDLSGCVPYTKNLRDPSPESSRKWFLDGVDIGENRDVEVKNRIPGNHVLTLVVTTQKLCSDSSKMEFESFSRPIVQISESNPCLYENFEVTGQNLEEHNITVWKWTNSEIGITDTTSESSFATKFDQPGSKKIILEVTDDKGCIGTDELELEISSPLDIPAADISYITITEDSNLEVNWILKDTSKFESITLIDENDNILFRTLDKSITSTVIASFDPQSRNCYRLYFTDRCGFKSVYSTPHCPVFAEVEKSTPFVIEVKWSPYIGWDRVDEYQVLRSIDAINWIKIGIVDGNTLSYTDKDLCNKLYKYCIKANRNAVSSYSNRPEDVPAIVVNNTPQDVQVVTVEENALRISWNRSDFEYTKSFLLSKWDDGGISWPDEFILGDSVTSYVDKDVNVNSTIYTYTITSLDHCQIPAPVGYQGQSILLQGGYEDNQANLTWNPYHEWEDGVSKYEIELKFPDGYKKIGEVDGQTTKFADDEIHLDIRGKYCYRIVAYGFDQKQQSLSNSICLIGTSMVWTPNAFSPNDDGLNTVFRPMAQFINLVQDGTYQTYEMNIYNRWGELLFTTTDIYNGWDGTYSSLPCPSASYMYHIRVKGLDNVLYNQKGLVRLMR